MIDLESNADEKSMTGTIRSTYELLNEVKKQNNSPWKFNNRLYQNKLGPNLDKGRNSADPRIHLDLLKGSQAYQKRQSSDVAGINSMLHPSFTYRINLNEDKVSAIKLI